MNFEQKVDMFQKLKNEVGEELARRLQETLDLASKAGISVVDVQNSEYRIVEFNFDPDMGIIGVEYSVEP